MKIITQKDKISRVELSKMAENMFGGLVKAVIDIEKEVIVVDGPMHADQETELVKKGSKQVNLWGINLYPEKSGEDFIEFDSMINLKPSQSNRTRGVENPKIRKKIKIIINKLVEK